MQQQLYIKAVPPPTLDVLTSMMHKLLRGRRMMARSPKRSGVGGGGVGEANDANDELDLALRGSLPTGVHGSR
jgi:hypothetical protein